ncbi:hypothetical protein DFH09DRAFT_1338411 [Mycena vulgaris]|nr:hypothetical protein DFH09DRAFT_1338411 [Mycena vulgaris]
MYHDLCSTDRVPARARAAWSSWWLLDLCPAIISQVFSPSFLSGVLRRVEPKITNLSESALFAHVMIIPSCFFPQTRRSSYAAPASSLPLLLYYQHLYASGFRPRQVLDPAHPLLASAELFRAPPSRPARATTACPSPTAIAGDARVHPAPAFERVLRLVRPPVPLPPLQGMLGCTQALRLNAYWSSYARPFVRTAAFTAPPHPAPLAPPLRVPALPPSQRMLGYTQPLRLNAGWSPYARLFVRTAAFTASPHPASLAPPLCTPALPPLQGTLVCTQPLRLNAYWSSYTRPFVRTAAFTAPPHPASLAPPLRAAALSPLQGTLGYTQPLRLNAGWSPYARPFVRTAAFTAPPPSRLARAALARPSPTAVAGDARVHPAPAFERVLEPVRLPVRAHPAPLGGDAAPLFQLSYQSIPISTRLKYILS